MLTSVVRTTNPLLFPKRCPENALGTIFLRLSPVQLALSALTAPSTAPAQGGVIQWRYELVNSSGKKQAVATSSCVAYLEGVNGQVVERCVEPAEFEHGVVTLLPNSAVEVTQTFEVLMTDPAGLACVNILYPLKRQGLEWDPYVEFCFMKEA
jgi:hypothetical protein